MVGGKKVRLGLFYRERSTCSCGISFILLIPVRTMLIKRKLSQLAMDYYNLDIKEHAASHANCKVEETLGG